MKSFATLAAKPARRPAPSRTQGGAATLVVVMLLFFVVSLVAGYASRNLIFEQRTSANQYRSTQSLEAAEAGLEWLQTMLNGGRIDAACRPTDNVAFNNFRQRYVNTNVATGMVNRNVGQQVRAACTFDGTAWSCVCPTTALDATSLPSVGPAFSVRFVNVASSRPGLIRAEINGCPSYELTCITAGNEALTGNCQSTLCSLVSLYSGAKSPPTAAVTARGTINGTLTVSNQAIQTAGLTVHAGAAIDASMMTLTSLPGTPPQASVLGSDASLTAPNLTDDTPPDCIECGFASVFGLRPATYRRQGGILEVDCTAPCNAAAVNAALASARAGRMVWLRGAGGLLLNGATDVIGTADPADPAGGPVVLVVEGPILIQSATARIYGLVYTQDTVTGARIEGGEIHGALVSAGNVAGGVAGGGLVAYDAAVLERLRLTSGSYVRVPGAWRDFP